MEVMAVVVVLVGLFAVALDLHVTMHGLLAAIGSLTVLVGFGWLIWMTFSPPAAILVTLSLAVFALRMGRPLFRSWRELERRAPAGEFTSEVARTVEPLRPAGLVRVDGTLWRAVSAGGPVAASQAVLILERRGLSLRVVPLSPEEANHFDVVAS